MVHPDDARLLKRAQTLGLLSELDAAACMAELESGNSLRAAQVLLRRRLMGADIIMSLMQQVRDVANSSQGVIGTKTWMELSSVDDILPPVRAGEVLAGLELKREVARGGMGILYEATSPAQPGKRLAVKVLTPQAAASETVVARFRQEAKLAATLEHPNLIKVHQAGVERQVHYLVMDFFDGKSLADLIRPGRLAPKKALSVMAQVAAACAYMHGQGVIHRDIKPANIMVGKGSQVCLTDFGLAKDVARVDSQLTQMGLGKLLGTPAYMAPEQASGELDRVGPWTDVYGMAAVIFRALTGRYPFAKGSYMGTIQAIATEDAPRLSGFRPDAPAALDDLLARAMSRDVSLRPSAGEMSAELGALAAQPILMPPGPPSEHV